MDIYTMEGIDACKYVHGAQRAKLQVLIGLHKCDIKM